MSLDPINALDHTALDHNLNHLLAELELLDLRLASEIQRVRRPNLEGIGEDFRGLLVSDQQIDELLATMPLSGPPEDNRENPHLELIRRRHEEIAGLVQKDQEGANQLRLALLQRKFGLSNFETNVVVLCLAPEIDLRYEALYAYAQDHLAKRRPTLNLALELFLTEARDKVALRQCFSEPSLLISRNLVRVIEDPSAAEPSFLSSILKLEPRVSEYLLGSDRVDLELQPLSQLVNPQASWSDIQLAAGIKSRLEKVVRQWAGPSLARQSILLQLLGPSGIGKKTIAHAICREMGKKLLLLDCAGLLESELPPKKLVDLAFREALLQDAILCWHNFDRLLDDQARSAAAKASLERALGNQKGLVILATETPWRAGKKSDNQVVLTVDLPRPAYPERKALWEGLLKERPTAVTALELGHMASKYRFNAGQIQQVVSTAQDLALWRDWEQGAITVEDLNQASRWHSNQRLGLLAQKINSRYTWEDIILPPDRKAQLQEICSYFDNMSLVYEQWKFQSKTDLGKGLNALFAGTSGTGKTMSAEVMSMQLGLDLYKIDLSSIVSKYIGETEKNLDRIFREAQDSNSVLFFDEADALFGKRSEVRDSHDRYANIETSYLLQKMEEYQGIVILATNFRNNMDDAFVRRMHFAVEFPFPEEEYRLQIWQRVFPPEAPLDEGLDLSYVARKYKVAGGNIKNIAVTSAFLAAAGGDPIGMKHVIWATKREYQKMGKLILEREFEPYTDLVKA